MAQKVKTISSQKSGMEKLLDTVERVGNKVPHPVVIFVLLIFLVGHFTLMRLAESKDRMVMELIRRQENEEDVSAFENLTEENDEAEPEYSHRVSRIKRGGG